jgi:hypothetical protein
MQCQRRVGEGLASLILGKERKGSKMSSQAQAGFCLSLLVAFDRERHRCPHLERGRTQCQEERRFGAGSNGTEADGRGLHARWTLGYLRTSEACPGAVVERCGRKAFRVLPTRSWINRR